MLKSYMGSSRKSIGSGLLCSVSRKLSVLFVCVIATFLVTCTEPHVELEVEVNYDIANLPQLSSTVYAQLPGELSTNSIVVKWDSETITADFSNDGPRPSEAQVVIDLYYKKTLLGKTAPTVEEVLSSTKYPDSFLASDKEVKVTGLDDGAVYYVVLKSITSVGRHRSKVTKRTYKFYTYSKEYSGDNAPVSKTDLITIVDDETFKQGHNADLNIIDTSKVSDFSQIFINKAKFTGDVSLWDVSNATKMTRMFSGAEVFNTNINNWEVDKVTDMAAMFYNAAKFTQNLDAWASKIGNVINWKEEGKDNYIFAGSGLEENPPRWCKYKSSCKKSIATTIGVPAITSTDSDVTYDSIKIKWNKPVLEKDLQADGTKLSESGIKFKIYYIKDSDMKNSERNVYDEVDALTTVDIDGKEVSYTLSGLDFNSVYHVALMTINKTDLTKVGKSEKCTTFTTRRPEIIMSLSGSVDDLLNIDLMSPNLELDVEGLNAEKAYEVSYNSILVTLSDDYSNTDKIIEETTANTTADISVTTRSGGQKVLLFNPIQNGIASIKLAENTSIYIQFELTAITNSTDNEVIYSDTTVLKSSVSTGSTILTFRDIAKLSLRDRLNFNLAGSYTLDTNVYIDLRGDWKTIGGTSPGDSFIGSLDGGDHTITIVSDSNSADGYSWPGLFGAIGVWVTNEKGIVKNLTIDVKSNLKHTAADSGILATLFRSGTIENVTITSSATIPPVYSVKGHAGGLVGRMDNYRNDRNYDDTYPAAHIKNVRVNNINIVSNGAYVGGIIGIFIKSAQEVVFEGLEVNANISTTYKNTYGESIVGGIIGAYIPNYYHTARLTRLVFNGSVAAPGRYAGGLIGIVGYPSNRSVAGSRVSERLIVSGKVGNLRNTFIKGLRWVGGAVGKAEYLILTAQVDDAITEMGSDERVIKIVGEQELGGLVGQANYATIKGYVRFKNSNYQALKDAKKLPVPNTNFVNLDDINTNDIGGIVSYGSGQSYIGGVLGAMADVTLYAHGEILINAVGAKYVGGIVGGIADGYQVNGYVSGTIIGNANSSFLGGFVGKNFRSSSKVHKTIGYVKNMVVVNTGSAPDAPNKLSMFISADEGVTANMFILSPSKVIGNGIESTDQILAGSNNVQQNSIVNYYDTAPTYSETNFSVEGTEYPEFNFGTDVGQWIYVDDETPPILAGGEEIFGTQ